MATATEAPRVDHAGPDVSKQSEFIPPTSSEDTVWIGFMDIVPVIGTLRESVELVLAVYEGNEAVVKEKEEAIENFMKGSSQKHKGTVPDEPAEDEYSGLRNVREVRMEIMIEYMAKGSKRGKSVQLNAAEKKKREEKVTAINKNMLEKIHIIKPKFTHYLEEELGRSGRGEHVFNNDILKFHFKVLKEFKETPNLGYQLNLQALEERDGSHTLSPKTAEEIGENMVVDFDKDELYVNANAVVYGEYCRELHQAMLAVLRCRNPEDIVNVPEELFEACCKKLCLKPEVLEKMDRQNKENIYEALVEGRLDVLSHIIPDMREDRPGMVEIYEALHKARSEVLSRTNLEDVDLIIGIMNKYEIYVDQLAKKKWLLQDKKGTRQGRVEKVRREVENMYKTDRGVNWCIRILEKVAP